MKLSKHEMSIQERLRAYEQPVDTEALWAKVAPPARRRRRIVAWVFAGIGIILISAVTGVFITQTEPAQELKSDSMAAEISGVSQIPAIDQTSQTIKPASTGDNAEIAEVTSDDQRMESNTIESHTPLEPSLRANVYSKSKHPGTEATLSPDSQTTSPISISQQDGQQNKEHAQALAIISENIASDVTTTTHLQSNERLVDAESSISSESSESNTGDATMENVPTRNSVTMAFLETPLLFPYGDLLKTQSTPLPSLRITGSKRHRVAIGLSAGMGFSQTSYSGNAAQARYINTLESRTDPLPSLHADLLAQYRISPKWILQSGISYARLTSRTTQSWRETERIEQPGEVIHIDPEGQVTTTPATTGATQTTMFHAVHHTYLHRVDVPLTLACRVVSLPRSRMYVQAGVLFQMMTRSEGSLPEVESGELYRWTNHDDSPYGNFATGLVAGIAFEHYLNERMALFANPQFTQHQIGIKYKTIVLDHSASVFSCRLGALYQF